MQGSFQAMLRAALVAACAGIALAPGGCATKSAAASPPCPPWVVNAPSHDNATSPNLGCKNALNLQNMVADPSDLVSGKTLGPADGAREALAVEAYKQGKVKDLKPTESATPTITTGTSGAGAGATQ